MTRIIIRIETKQGRTRHEIEDSKTIAEIEAMLGYTIHKINGSSVLREPLSNGDLLTASLRDATTIDSFLSAQSGLIQRSASSLCNHNSNSMCEYCCPLDPFNQVYLSEKKIKFLSFYSFLKKQSLPSYSLSVKQCSAHLPYPKGLCSKCQPSAVTLESQVFRMVDHVEFDEVMVDAFISGWRDTGLQRYGVLYGRYESYDVVPLGIKAIVDFIYEPPQENTTSSIQILNDPIEQAHLKTISSNLSSYPIGQIYTDLTDDQTNTSSVLYKRHPKSYFLSSSEIIQISNQQIKHPCKYSDKSFSSRFVTCIITVNNENKIDIKSFQASHLSEEFIKNDMITASIDPTIMLLNKSSLRKYIPEVFYTYKNEFNTIIKKNAVDGFPVDYLIVSLTHGFPNTKSNKLHISFPIENRKTQSLSKFDGEMLNDFHFILFLLKQDILDQETVSILFNVVNKTSKLDELVCRDSWMNLIAIVDGVKNDGGRNSSRKKDVEWGCRHCTFFNHGTDICEMCGLPSD